MFQASFHTAWTESASLADKDVDSSEYYSKMFNIMFRVTSGVTMAVAGLTPILFSILIKGNYDDAYFQMPILLLSMLFFSLSSFMGGLYTAKKKTKSVGFTTIGAAIINIVVDLLLINKIGLYAASISTLISYIALTIFRMINIKKYVDIKFDVKSIFIIIIISIVSCMLLYFNLFAIKIINIVLSTMLAIYINKETIKIISKSFYKKISKNKK